VERIKSQHRRGCERGRSHIGANCARQQSLADITSNSLLTETERRKQLLKILIQQAELYHDLEKSKFNDAPLLVAKAMAARLRSHDRFHETAESGL